MPSREHSIFGGPPLQPTGDDNDHRIVPEVKPREPVGPLGPELEKLRHDPSTAEQLMLLKDDARAVEWLQNISETLEGAREIAAAARDGVLVAKVLRSVYGTKAKRHTARDRFAEVRPWIFET